MARSRSITIKEVAELAEVSQMTVSRVLNQSDAVREETRKRVQDAIRQLNYRPNLMARNLARGKSLLLGVLYQNSSSAYLGEMMVTALKTCRQEGHHLVLEDMPQSEDGSIQPQAIADRLALVGLDGLIVTPLLARTSELIDTLAEQIPQMVVLGTNNLNSGITRISFDDFSGAKKLTEALINKGHKRIAFLSGHADCPASIARRDGFEAAMADAGLKMTSDLMIEGEYNLETGMAAGDKLLSQSKRPTAVFCANDDMAAGVQLAAHRKGLKLPDDLSVAGFDDTAIANLVWPQITTVRQPIGRMTQIAVETLSKGSFPSDLEGAAMLSMNHLQITDVELIERDSVASPK